MVEAASDERLAAAVPGTFFLRVERFFDASPERVFAAFTQTRHLAQWWGPKGMTCPQVEIEARPGGPYRTCMRAPDGQEHWVSGVFREVDPPRRLVFTWAWEENGVRGHESIVTLTFVAREKGTFVSLVHTDLASQESRDKHEHGWKSTLESLQDFLWEGGASD
jgi:uncharacterized protein YndB with AHSA1/START domain